MTGIHLLHNLISGRFDPMKTYYFGTPYPIWYGSKESYPCDFSSRLKKYLLRLQENIQPVATHLNIGRHRV